MSFVNTQTQEIHLKLVYYGPGLSGKTTNLQYIYKQTAADKRSKMVSLSTDNERTLFFDFLPLDVGKIRVFDTKIHLYTVPGQVVYEVSRKLILRGVDGVVFVADSQVERLEANLESFESLERNLDEQGYSIDRIPLVMQYNKRDLPNISPVSDLARVLNKHGWQEVEATASQGIGVFETLKALTKLVLMDLRG